MHTFETMECINASLTELYRSGCPLIANLNGVHPRYLVTEAEGSFYFTNYRVGSPNLLGPHPIRRVAFLEGIVDNVGYDPGMVIEGIGYHSNKLFGIEIEAERLAEVAARLDIETVFTTH